ncbi:hypothetical protein G4H71_13205 [Rhodococcus triatomae]|uniref:Uncharacterized protein n=1 Tax=Rhodococcus triatomae TaxID=300028 RepID=A0A1G8H272_9NOCA|nr:hypothetical protein [Rhodococcus triatomae]QNG17336.1 hypothetical protein G4H72_17175 [Rhodococcus triatomae]QNG21654.1 hypothetical protein G4H71_13205 [Rhodococcus triatomae]SDI00631.1 hypothetical protein SAMN05444695_104284 [Rhodococcus triatomae]
MPRRGGPDGGAGLRCDRAARRRAAGDSGKLTELIGYLDGPDPDFAIVTP